MQRRNLTRALPLGDWQIVSVEGNHAAGALHVEERPLAHHLHLLVLLPAFQRQGLGTLLLKREIGRAGSLGKGLTLKVIKSNPARHLYDRMGFVVTGEDAVSWDMCHGRPAIEPG